MKSQPDEAAKKCADKSQACSVNVGKQHNSSINKQRWRHLQQAVHCGTQSMCQNLFSETTEHIDGKQHTHALQLIQSHAAIGISITPDAFPNATQIVRFLS